jgi:hypothetical protein
VYLSESIPFTLALSRQSPYAVYLCSLISEAEFLGGLRHFLIQDGVDPTQNWFDSLQDVAARVAILRRLDGLAGHLGDRKFWRDGS